MFTVIAIIGTVAVMTAATVLNPKIFKQFKQRPIYFTLNAMRSSGEYVYGTILGQGASINIQKLQ